MIKSKVSGLAATLIILLFCIAGNVLADRGIRVKKITDLSHGSNKLGEYKALIIGINDYRDTDIPDLETAVSDAKAMAGILEEKYGFKIKLLLDRQATREAIYRSLRKLARSTKLNDSVLIYFAGHGDLDRTYNDGWWIPAEAVGRNPVTYFDNVQVQKAMRSMKARHVLLISDSCYSGTLFGKARSLPPVIDDKYYLNLYNEKSRWAMTSGNKTPVSDLGSEGHSVFAYQLLKKLEKNEKPFLSTQEIYTRIAPVIVNNSEQMPLCRPIRNTGDQGGEFVFVASIKKEPTPAIPKAKKGTLDKEMLFWQSIQDSEDLALYEEYLERFPNGFFASIAKKKIQALKQKTVIASIPPEVSKSKLFVEVDPKDSRVRILNIKPRFQQGMVLASGRYNVETSKRGYQTKKMWIKLEAGEDKKLEVKLEQMQASIQPAKIDAHRVPSGSSLARRDGINRMALQQTTPLRKCFYTKGTKDYSNCDFSGEDLDYKNFRGCDLKHSVFRKADLDSTDFQHAFLQGTDFQGARIKGAEFEGANFQNARGLPPFVIKGLDERKIYSQKRLMQAIKNGFRDLRGAHLNKMNLQGLSFKNAKLKRAELLRMNLQNMNFESVDLQNARLTRSNLKNANFKNANLKNTTLTGTALQGANLTWADMSDGYLTEANLQNAVLRGANLGKHARANFEGADLSGATGLHPWLKKGLNSRGIYSMKRLIGAIKGGFRELEYVYLNDADLKGINLRGAQLWAADLEKVNLQKSDLRGAELGNTDLKGADLRGANLLGAKLSLHRNHIRKANFEGATWVNGMVCKKGSIGKCVLDGAKDSDFGIRD